MKKQDFIKTVRRTCHGTDSDTQISTLLNVKKGDTFVVIEHTIKEKMPIQDLYKAEDLFDRLTCGDGRRAYELEELAHNNNPDPYYEQ